MSMSLHSALHQVPLRYFDKRIGIALSLKLPGVEFTNPGSKGTTTADTTSGQNREKERLKSLSILVMNLL